MKGVIRADRYVSYSLLRKTVKWPKKVAFWLINCALFNSFQIYQKLNPTSQMIYKEFLLQMVKDWATERWRQTQIQTQTQHAQEHHLKPLVCLMRTPLGDFRVKENILLGGAMFVLPTKKEVKLGTSASSA